MNNALTYIYYIFNKCLSFVFNDMLIAENVSVGWVCICLIVFGLLMGSILNIPHRIGNFSRFDDMRQTVYNYKTGKSSTVRISRRRV